MAPAGRSRTLQGLRLRQEIPQTGENIPAGGETFKHLFIGLFFSEKDLDEIRVEKMTRDEECDGKNIPDSIHKCTMLIQVKYVLVTLPTKTENTFNLVVQVQTASEIIHFLKPSTRNLQTLPSLKFPVSRVIASRRPIMYVLIGETSRGFNCSYSPPVCTHIISSRAWRYANH